MNTKRCEVSNNGRIFKKSVVCFITKNDPPYLTINKWMVSLPDSDKLMLTDEDGYRYKRVYPNIVDHYVFEKI